MIVPLLLCAGMLVIPLVALASSAGSTRSTQVTSKLAVKGGRVEPPTTVTPLWDGSSGDSTPIASLGASEGTPDVSVIAAGAAAPTQAVPQPSPAPVAPAASAPSNVRPAQANTTVTAATHSTTTSPPTTRPAPSTTAPPARPQHSQSGPASYYDEAPSGTCAHPTLAFGTVVSIVDTDNGRTASCTVEDRGPYAGGRIIDLARDVFSQLAPISQGVINVRISW